MSSIDNTNFGEFLYFHVYRRYKSLAVSNLSLLEELKKDGLLSEEYFADKRKKTLDNLNQKAREIKDIIDSLDINLKTNYNRE